MTTMPHPAGMIFVLRSGGLVGETIRLLTHSRVNHAGVCLGDGRTVEAQAKGAVIKREQDNDRVIYGVGLYAHINGLDPYANPRIADEALRLVGTPYGFTDILALGLADLGLRWKWLERKVDSQHALICSQLVDQACLAAGVHLFADGRMPGRVDPGDLEWVISNSGRDVSVDGKTIE